MDPLAHTLCGAALGEMGLAKRKLDRVVLIAAANLPDVDALAGLWGEEAQRSFRRGWTHGVLAMVVLPLVLGSIAWLFGRERRIYGLACLGVWSHPLLDWLNTYGIRLLMPFDGTWFYGDALFIVDPYLWLALGTAVMLARSKSLAGIATWIAIGLAATSLVMFSERSQLGAKLVWIACMVAIAIARWRKWGEGRFERWARAGFAVALVYIAAMIAASRAARSQASEWLEGRGLEVGPSMAAPSPGDPFLRTVVASTEGEYRVLEIDWLGDPIREVDAIPLGPRDAIVEAARRTPSIQGYVGRLRFPAYEVEQVAGGWIVRMRDARRAGRSSRMVVRLNDELEPIETYAED